MGMMIANTQLPAIMRRGNNIHHDEVVEHDAPKVSYSTTIGWGRFARSKREPINNSTRTDWVKYVAPVHSAEHFRILLIGKDQRERQSMCNTLSQHLNFAIDYLEASGGESALQTVGREAVSLIIFGDDIADMDGLEFLGRLNKKCGKSKIPVIEILSYGAASTGVQALKMGAHDYLLKDADGCHFELLPILVSRIYSEQQAMNSLCQTASVHQTIADIIPSVIYQLSLQGGAHDVHISRQISELGLSADKWGSDAELHHQMCHEKDRPVVKAALEHSYKTGAAFQCQYRINTLGGVVRWFNDKAKVILDKYGRPLFLQGVMTDITSIKAMEAELMHYREMLDKMVKDRTERLDRRVSILESCNTSLGENYHKMHQMYLELFLKSQALGGGIGGSGVA